MLIKELFTKPIDRPINGVIKADQDDAASVWQELDEYVITKELDIHFRKFFGAYLTPSIVPAITSSVWSDLISGFSLRQVAF